MKNKGLLKRLFACLLSLSLLFPLGMLTACDGGGEGGISLPAGMKNATEGASGYYFFVPDGWLVERVGGVTMANVSAYSSASFSLAVFESERLPEEYFEASRPELEAKLADLKMEASAEKTAVGDTTALRYLYSGQYTEGKTHHVMQYIAKKGANLFVFTYMANSEEFDTYKKAIETAVGHFRFTDAALDTPAPIPPMTDGAPEGMQMISDPTIHAYSLYVPQAWTADAMSGICGAYVSKADRSNISLSCHYRPAGVSSLKDYFAVLRPINEKIYTDYTVLSEHKEGDPTVKIGGYEAARYLMSGKSGGEEYRIMQLHFVRDSYIYVFTYTARADLFDAHTAEVDAIIAAVTFP